MGNDNTALVVGDGEDRNSGAAQFTNDVESGIAVIGMACKFPGADDPQAFWENIKNKVSSIQEIPADRWDKSEFYSLDKEEKNKSVSKWGGFIEGIDKFDAGFFNVSRREAELMDPQQRVMLELAWRCFEDAGHAPKTFDGGKTGVFIGSFSFDYRELLERQAIPVEGHVSTGTHATLIANRISHYFNLCGPSQLIDVACAGSLVAVHDAVNSIHNGECHTALAGGVNLLCSPKHFISFSKTGMLSPDGSCKTFDEKANGYVRGEGAGLILLKRLDRAVEDGDRIHGVIRGSAKNHGGRARTLTAPSALAQSKVIVEAHQKANVPPNTIGYIEAHGTGTPKGDPIEIHGLIKAFAELGRHYGKGGEAGKQTCGLGSAKTNLGHLEAAAGVAGIIKTLLSMKHRLLPALVNFNQINPQIHLEDSPFFIVQANQEWRASQDEAGRTLPLRAGVSSFGFGGVNAHVVLEEYISKEPRHAAAASSPVPALALVLLSAKSVERLHVQAQHLLDWIRQTPLADADLPDLAYTLQVGRDALEERLALTVGSMPELIEKLTAFKNGATPIEGLIRGQVQRYKEALGGLIHDDDMPMILQAWVEKGKYAKLLNLWVKGLVFDWNRLYPHPAAKPRRISLPTYPFARERYWVPEMDGKARGASARMDRSMALHALLHRNTSDLSEQRFSSTFTGEEFFLRDHVVQGVKTLPAMAYLEMAREAVQCSSGAMSVTASGQALGMRIGHVVWLKPTSVQARPVELHIGLYAEDGGRIGFEIYSVAAGQSGVGDEETMHCQGVAEIGVIEAGRIDIAALQARCHAGHMTASQCYEYYRHLGIEYGPGLRAVSELYVGVHQVLAKLHLPSAVAETQGKYLLHPSMLDAVLQASLGLLASEAGSHGKPALPIALDELEIAQPCSAHMWAVARHGKDTQAGRKVQKLDIDVCDSLGNVCIRLRGLALDKIHEAPVAAQASQTLPASAIGDARAATPQEAFELMTFKEVWQEQALSAAPLPEIGLAQNRSACLAGATSAGAHEIKTLVCFASQPATRQAVVEAMQAQNSTARLVFVAQDADGTTPSFAYGVARHHGPGYEEVFRRVREAQTEVDAILYLWQLEDADCTEDYSPIVFMVQAIAATKLKTRRILLAGQFDNGLDGCYLDSWTGFERSIGLALPQLQITSVIRATPAGFADQVDARRDWANTLCAELLSDKAESALYQDGRRHVRKIEATRMEAGENLLKTGKTYLVTGGMGGLGYLFSRHLASGYAANLVLTGRSPLDEAMQAKLDALEALGGRARYRAADVGDPAQMREAVDWAKVQFGAVDGVIHAAGIEGAQSILVKTLDDFMHVLAAKVQGTMALDKALEGESPDFICYFSSSSAILGDFGSCDYAIGNRFQMAYAAHRDRQSRPGKTVVIDWPLWKEGGMRLGGEEGTQMVLKSSGQQMLETADGIAMFERILQQAGLQHLVLLGQRSRVERFLGLTPAQRVTRSAVFVQDGKHARARRLELVGLSLAQCVEWDLKQHVGQLLKIPREQLNVGENLAEFGFDSINLAEFATRLSRHYGVDITPALFFGYPTLEKLNEYFLKEQQEAIQALYPEGGSRTAAIEAPQTPAPGSRPARHRPSRFGAGSAPLAAAEAIAIVGMSGRFPGARNIDEMWRILAEGRDVVGTAPAERGGGWQNAPYKCGFAPGVSEFDPLFFEISPREAEGMDPRQRLLLQEAWNALEDAGYGARQIRAHAMGMFVGVEDGDYQSLRADGGGLASNHNGILAARLAYFLDFTGPVLAINTACSSGLVAAHQACAALRNGECDTALAAAVNLMLTPLSYVAMEQAGMLSADGKCQAFDQRANGMVPAEAVAVLVLKRLSQAEADGDSIHAVIQGSGINYDGKTNGITAPSGVSQCELIKSVHRKYRIDAESIDYIVTHGTGTRLGDPIEVNALNEAFKSATKKQGYCALTSNKPNFGHTLAASGLVSVIALVQAMRHQTIPASLHCEQENTYIHWQDSPFYVNQQNQAWPQQEGRVRIGAVSAFGVSGTNAHMVLRSHAEPARHAEAAAPYYLIALSAKTAGALDEKVADMIGFLEGAKEGHRQSLAEIGYTLLEGRQHFRHRLAIVIQGWDDALYALKQSASKEKAANRFNGKLARDFTTQNALQQSGQDLIAQGAHCLDDQDRYRETLFALADMYCRGYALDWGRLFGETKPRRVSLPGYPFAKERYWARETRETPTPGNAWSAAGQAAGARLHPLLHTNTSNLQEQRFSSTFHGGEFFLKDHVVKGARVLPGVAHLEMARAALAIAADARPGEPTAMRIRNIVWARPLVVGDAPLEVHIGLRPDDRGGVAYEISSRAQDGTDVLHSQGVAQAGCAIAPARMDIAAIKARCDAGQMGAGQCYAAFAQIGLEYGPALQAISALHIGERQVLARLLLPPTVADTVGQYLLHPSLLDAALQSSLGLAFGGGEGRGGLALPFALDELEIIHPCSSSMWALASHGKGGSLQRLDIDLCDDEGIVCVRLRGLASRIFGDPVQETGSLLLRPEWQAQAVAADLPTPAYARHVVMLCGVAVDAAQMADGMAGVHCIAPAAQGGGLEADFGHLAATLLEAIQRLIEGKPTAALIQVVTPTQGARQAFAGLSGMLKTARLENSRLVGQLVAIEDGETATGLIAKLMDNGRNPQDQRIRYRQGERQVETWKELAPAEENTGSGQKPWKAGGVVLITGGLGGLGLIFAAEIARQAKGVRLILTGRSEPGADRRARLLALESLGAQVTYRQVDVADREAVLQLVHEIQEEFGGLDGIIHGAGVTRDAYILKKNAEELHAVLAPKVAGIVNLDEAGKDLALDFFICLSSIAATHGNPGQADYAAANAFMDAYAGYRNHLATLGLRHGHALSINWPLWAEGGMRVDAATERMMTQNSGMQAMQTATGIEALYRALAGGRGQVLAVEGILSRMRQKLLTSPAATPAVRAATVDVDVDLDALRDKVRQMLARTISALLKVNPEDIDGDSEFNEYGFDSITLTEFGNRLNQEYRIELTPTIFFEYPTLAGLSGHLLDEHRAVFAARFASPAMGAPKNNAETADADAYADAGTAKGRNRFAPLAPQSPAGSREAIAVIGMSGCFPMAEDIHAFWNNLLLERDCIGEIPADRWDWRGHYGDPAREANKTNVKWGGFIEGMAEFDPLFFGISPKEAESMDPQQRLLMTHVWKAIEDAGYSAASLSGSATAIYVGTADSGYGGMIEKAVHPIEGHSATGMVPSVGPNRMSYLLNLHGPSEPVETACSSSLVALRKGVLVLESGECGMAIVGGVNAIVGPQLHISFNKAGMLAEDGRCKTFSDRADGYVRGEGVGMLVLKKLGAAELARDHVYGLIIGSAQNHGGRANSLTAPNPKAQAQLLKTAYANAGIDARSVGYIEAHGTGTALGDPVEFNGLKAAFKDMAGEAGKPTRDAHCGLGSVKSNIGHLELAAGVAGVIKVLLQLKHRTLVKSIATASIRISD